MAKSGERVLALLAHWFRYARTDAIECLVRQLHGSRNEARVFAEEFTLLCSSLPACAGRRG